MAWTIRIPKWQDFQHYGKARPPWVKVHRPLLDKRAWRALHGSAAKLLVDLWLLAAEGDEKPKTDTSGEIRLSLKDLAWRIRADEAEMLADLQVLSSQEFVVLSSEALEAVQRHARASSAQVVEVGSRDRGTTTTRADNTRDPKVAQRVLMPIIRKRFWIPDGKPIAEWSEARECDVIRMLVERGHSVDDLLTLAEGLTLIREANGLYCDTVSWILPETKLSFRMLVKARSGAVVLMEHAKRAYWTKANRRPVKHQASVGPIGDIDVPGVV